MLFINLFLLLIDLPNHGVFWWLRLVFVVLSLLMIGAIIWLLLVSTWIKEHHGSRAADLFKFSSFKKSRLSQRWAKIEQRLVSERPEELKLAVIEAEEFLDNFLKAQNIPGRTLLEKAKILEQQEALDQATLHELIEGFRTADSIIHNPDAQLSKSEAKLALQRFEKVVHLISGVETN